MSRDHPMWQRPAGGHAVRFWTWAEIEAAGLLGCRDPHEAGNRLIELAERIKAERAVVAMGAIK